MLPAGIFVYVVGKYGLRAAKFREIYEIRAYGAVTESYKGEEKITLVYYDYKKMQYCITTISLGSGYKGSVYHSFCWAMAVEREGSVKVIDISPREYEKK